MPVTKSIQLGVPWPGSRSIIMRASEKYKDLEAALDLLEIGGDSIAVEITDDHARRAAQAYVHHVGKRKHAKSQGWNYQTTTYNHTLYVRRIKLGGHHEDQL